MLLSTKELLDIPVMSLQTGTEIAVTTHIVIDPATLHILSYELYGNQLTETPSFLRVEDIRELSDIGFIVDSSDVLTILDDIVVDIDSYKNPLQLDGLKVIDDHGEKLGKIESVIMDTMTFQIEQLHVKQPLFKNFSDTNLLINRAQVLDVTKDHVVVRSATVRANAHKSSTKQALLDAMRRPATPRPESAKSDSN